MVVHTHTENDCHNPHTCAEAVVITQCVQCVMLSTFQFCVHII